MRANGGLKKISNSSRIEDFLQSARTGEEQGTDQSFSVDFNNLASRYQTFQSKDGAYYLLRLIQGLIAEKAKAISISTTRNSLQIRVEGFEHSLPDWIRPDALVDLVKKPQEWSPALGSVCVSLLCATGQDFESYEWHFQGRALSLDFKNGDVLSVSDSHLSNSQLTIIIKKTRQIFRSSTSIEHAACTTRLVASRVPIRLDNQPIELHIPTPPTQENAWYENYSIPFWLSEAKAEPEPNTDWKDLGEGVGLPTASKAWSSLAWFCGSTETDFRMAVHSNLRGMGQVFPVIDGVIGEMFLSPKLPACAVYIDAKEIDKDLSSLTISDEKALVKRATPYVLKLLQHTRAHSQHIKIRWDRSYPNYTTNTVLHACSYLFGLPYCFAPLRAIIYPTEMAASFCYHKIKEEERQNSFESELKEKLDELVSKLNESS